jgi:hypothetical protein
MFGTIHQAVFEVPMSLVSAFQHRKNKAEKYEGKGN